MDFEQLLEIVQDEPVFESSLLLAGKADPALIRLQLSRWKRSRRIYQLRRGLYTLAPPYQKVRPHPFVIANRLVRASYVSCQSALAFYGLIPENVPVTISVTTLRPGRRAMPLGYYEYRHIRRDLFSGYRLTELSGGQQAFIATPEKALLDLVYLRPAGDLPDFLQEMRLQNLAQLDRDELQRLADLFDKPKIARAVQSITDLAQSEIQEYQPL